MEDSEFKDVKSAPCSSGAAALHRPPDPLVVLHHFLPKPVEVESTPAARLGTKPNGPLSTRQRHPNRRPGLTSADLSQHLKNLQNDPAYQKLAAKRQSLPAWSARRHVVDTIAGHQVTIIAGSTGSGKSTQCPAFLLDDAIECGKGADCHIVVTQPRRISAIGVAVRPFWTSHCKGATC